MFVAMPSKLLPNGNHKDIAHPINTEVREQIQTAVLKEYEATEHEEQITSEPVEAEDVELSSTELSDDSEFESTEQE